MHARAKVTYSFSSITLAGCDVLDVGLRVNGVDQPAFGTNAGGNCGPPGSFVSVPSQRISVPLGSTVQIYLHDEYCTTTLGSDVTYYSDHTGTADNASVFNGGGITTRKLPTQVDINDGGGGGCGFAGTNNQPLQGKGSLDLITNAPVG